MIAGLQLDLARMRAARPEAGPVRMGRVVACDGGLIEVAGLPLLSIEPDRAALARHGLALDDLQQTVSIAIVNTLGAIVRTVDLGLQGAGRHTTSIGLAGLPVGTYIVRMVVPGAMGYASPSGGANIFRVA
jgi:hypothetical protein